MGSRGIGIAVGAGFYVESAISVIIVIVGIELIPPLLTKIGPKRLRSKELSLTVLVGNPESIPKVYDFLQGSGVYIESIRIKDVTLDNNTVKHEMDMRLSIITNKNTAEFYATIKKQKFIETVDVESI